MRSLGSYVEKVVRSDGAHVLPQHMAMSGDEYDKLEQGLARILPLASLSALALVGQLSR